MTLEEIRKSTKVWLTPADIAEVCECDPQGIREQAHEDPRLLGFPVTVVKSRTKIPRVGFIAWMDGRK